MAHVKIQYDVMDAFCMDVFQRFGFTKEESRIISDVLLLSDVYGIESHGAQRLVRYHKGIASGMIKVHAKPEIVFETPVSAVVDGHDGMGQLIGHFAMDLAIKKAKEIGMAIVTVRDSNHFGIAGYYAKMACDQGSLVWPLQTQKPSLFRHSARKPCWAQTQLLFPCRLNHIRSSSMHLQVSSPAVSSRCTEKPRSQFLTAGVWMPTAILAQTLQKFLPTSTRKPAAVLCLWAAQKN